MCAHCNALVCTGEKKRRPQEPREHWQAPTELTAPISYYRGWGWVVRLWGQQKQHLSKGSLNHL